MDDQRSKNWPEKWRLVNLRRQYLGGGFKDFEEWLLSGIYPKLPSNKTGIMKHNMGFSGGGVQTCLIFFSPILGEMIQFDELQ